MAQIMEKWMAGEPVNLSDREAARVWALARLKIEGETAATDGARVAAIGLVLRHHGLANPAPQAVEALPTDPEAIEALLRAKLARLLS